jgi:hypothetical protein
MDYYDSEYRRQYCRERIAQARDEYRRAQAPPRSEHESSAWMRSMWDRMRQRAASRAPAYRS